MTSLSIPFALSTQQLTAGLGQGFGKANGAGLANATIYGQLQRQAAMLGYQDVYKLLFWMALGMVFTAFLLNKNKPGQGGGGGGMH